MGPKARGGKIHVLWTNDYSGKNLGIKLWTLKKETSTRMILQGLSFICGSYQGVSMWFLPSAHTESQLFPPNNLECIASFKKFEHLIPAKWWDSAPFIAFGAREGRIWFRIHDGKDLHGMTFKDLTCFLNLIEHTVDGRNPAPPGMQKNPVTNGINYLYQLVQEFFHQQ